MKGNLSAKVSFFALLHYSRVKVIRNDCESDNISDKRRFYELEKRANEERHKFSLRVKSQFQIVYYQVTHGKHERPLHVMNALTIHKKCRSRELITALNK